MRSGLGMNLGLGSAFRNPLAPNRNQPLELANQGFANELELDGIVPRFYGKNLLVVPKHAAQPYSINYGTSLKHHAVFLLGYGPLVVSNIRIGTTPIGNFGSEIEWEVRQGNPGDAGLTLFTQDVNETNPNQILPFGSIVSVPVGYCNEIMIDLYWPNGCYQLANVLRPDGTVGVAPVTRQMGVHVLVQRKDNGTVVYDASTVYTPNIQGPFYRTIRIPSLASTEYNVAVQRAQAPGDQQTVVDAVQCVSVKGIKYGNPLKPYRNAAGDVIPLALIAVRASGGAKSQGALDALNCRVTSILDTWNGSSWVQAQSNAPADIVVDLLSGVVNPRPIPKSRINGTAFATWKTATESGGYTFNDGFTQSQSVEDAIADVCAAGRGLYLPRDSSGKHGCRFEAADSNIAQVVTQLNSANFRFQKVWGDIPHAIKAQFVSREAGFIQDEAIIPRPGYTEATATTFEAQSFRGVDSHAQVYKLGLYHWAAALDRPTTYEFDMPIEHMLMQIGSRIKYSNEIIGYGLGEGIVTGVVLDGSDNCTAITVSQPLDMTLTKTYSVRVRLKDGTTILRQINAANGLFYTLTFTTPIPDGQPMPEPDDLVVYNYLGQEADLIVVDIVPDGDLNATIQCLDYSEGIYSAANGTIPPYTPPVSIPERSPVYVPPPPMIVGIFSDENIMLQNGTSQTPRIKLTYRYPASGRIEFVQWQIKRADDSDNDFSPPNVVSAEAGEIYISDVQEGVNYTIQIRTVADNNYKSDWVAESHVVVGRSTPPPDVTKVVPHGQDLSIEGYVPPVDFSHFWVKAMNGIGTWDEAETVILRLVSTTFPMSRFPRGLVSIFIKAVDTAGNVSANAFRFVFDFAQIQPDNIVDQGGFAYGSSTGSITLNGVFHSTPVYIDGLPYSVPDSIASFSFWVNKTAPFWTNPAAPFWGRERPSHVSITVNYLPPSDITEPWRLKSEHDVKRGGYFIQRNTYGDKPFWSGNPLSPFWTEPAAEFWDSASLDEWQLFSGDMPGTRRKHKIRVYVPRAQVGITALGKLLVYADMPDVQESFINLVVGPAGTPIPLTKSFRRITEVLPIPQVDAAYPNALTVKLLDSPPYPVSGGQGPRLQVFDSTNTPTTGKVAGRVRGW